MTNVYQNSSDMIYLKEITALKNKDYNKAVKFYSLSLKEKRKIIRHITTWACLYLTLNKLKMHLYLNKALNDNPIKGLCI